MNTAQSPATLRIMIALTTIMMVLLSVGESATAHPANQTNSNLFASVETAPALGTVGIALIKDHTIVTAVLDHIEAGRSTDFIWVGHIQGVENSQVTLAVKNGIMIGNVVLPKARYSISYLAGAVHAISEIDQRKFPPEAKPIEVVS